jgi:hypothetical protein
MLKKIISTLAIATALMFSGCGGDSDGEDRLEALHAIDKGNPESAIALLESKANKTNEDYALLGSAYASKAGFTMIDITTAFIDASENETGKDDMVNLVSSLIGKASSSALDDLKQSIKYYEDIPSDKRTDDQNFKLGMTYIIQISLMIDTESKKATPDNVDSILESATSGFKALGTVINSMDDEDLKESYKELEGETATENQINQIITDYKNI